MLRAFVLTGLLAGALLWAPFAGAAASPIDYAYRALGVEYVWGGGSPTTGFDCSGLVVHVFRKAWGLRLPHSARLLSGLGRHVDRSKLRPGDLVFYNTHRPHSHVGIYIGGGRFIHAPRTGAYVRIDSLRSHYWRSRYDGARRLSRPTPRSAHRSRSE